MADHLIPEDLLFDGWGIRVDYHPMVAGWLLQEVQRRPVVATVVCLPSFELEWAVRLHGSEPLGFSITLTEATTPIYGANQASNVSVATQDAEVPTATAIELIEIWSKMLCKTTYQPSASLGLDGVSYHFLCNKDGQGVRCGQTWSPDAETSCGHLVSLAHTLREFIKADERSALGAKLESEMEWFREIPIRPPLREKATVILKKQIELLLSYRRHGIMTDAEIVGQITHAFDGVRYPPLLDVLDIIEMIPSDLLIRVRSQFKE